MFLYHWRCWIKNWRSLRSSTADASCAGDCCVHVVFLWTIHPQMLHSGIFGVVTPSASGESLVLDRESATETELCRHAANKETHPFPSLLPPLLLLHLSHPPRQRSPCYGALALTRRRMVRCGQRLHLKTARCKQRNSPFPTPSSPSFSPFPSNSSAFTFF